MAKAGTLVAKTTVKGEELKALGDLEVIGYMEQHSIDSSYLKAIKRLTRYTDATIADWLDISPRTMRTYSVTRTAFKKKLSEQVVMLRAAFEKGQAVLGSVNDFDQWLDTPNLYFDGKKPITFLGTTSGIRYIYDRLTAMEYGDNI